MWMCACVPVGSLNLLHLLALYSSCDIVVELWRTILVISRSLWTSGPIDKYPIPLQLSYPMSSSVVVGAIYMPTLSTRDVLSIQRTETQINWLVQTEKVSHACREAARHFAASWTSRGHAKSPTRIVRLPTSHLADSEVVSPTDNDGQLAE